jgi:hypothetical protein
MPDDTNKLTGDAAWRSEKAGIAKRNDAAQARARELRAARDAAAAAAQRQADRREAANLPTQPRP